MRVIEGVILHKYLIIIYIMYYLNFYEKGSCQPRKRNGKVLSELFTYQDTDVQNAVHASNLQLTKRRSV